jgi:uncharacterized protein
LPAIKIPFQPANLRHAPDMITTPDSGDSRSASPRLQLPPLEKGDYYRYHVMVKPSGSLCNLECSYCFYLHKKDLLRQPTNPKMSESLLEEHIRQYIEAQTGHEVVFSWQGGEPTMLGLDFFRQVITLQQRYKKPEQSIENDLQTNGILLNDEWCYFLKEHDFLVGLSIDGPPELHDVYRRSKGDQPTSAQVMRAAGLLRDHDISFNAMCVVNRVNVCRPIDVYRFLCDEVRPRIIQFIPGVEPVDFCSVAPGYWRAEDMPFLGSPKSKPGCTGSVVTEWSVDPDDWGSFLCKIWDVWLRRDYGKIFVDQFENMVSMMFGFGPQKCVNCQFCGKALAIEHNGDLYSCDHFVYPEYRLGNILELHQGDLAFSERQKEFALAKYRTLPNYCRNCSYLQYCWGDCPKNRFLKSPEGETGLNYLCDGLKAFFKKAICDRRELARRLQLP